MRWISRIAQVVITLVLGAINGLAINFGTY